MGGNKPADPFARADSACADDASGDNAFGEKGSEGRGKANKPSAGKPSRRGSEQTAANIRKNAIALARDTITMIGEELAALRGDGDRQAAGLKGDARLKALLSLTKAVQSLEDMIIRLEHAVDEAGERPSDPLALLERLSRKIAGLAPAGKGESLVEAAEH